MTSVTYEVQVQDDKSLEWRTLRTFTDEDRARRYYKTVKEYHYNESCRIIRRVKHD